MGGAKGHVIVPKSISASSYQAMAERFQATMKLPDAASEAPGFLIHFPGLVNVASQILPVTAGC